MAAARWLVWANSAVWRSWRVRIENHISIWLSHEAVEPRSVGGCAVQEDPVVVVEEGFDGGSAVGGEVVDDAVQFEMGRYSGVEIGEEGHEVR